MNNELVKVSVVNGIQTALGRDLHEFLGVDTRYDTWMNRLIEKYDFVEGVEFIAIVQKRSTAQGNETNYINHQITLDMAKEISMVSRTEKGKQARQYFIECERELRNQQPKELTRMQILEMAMETEKENLRLLEENNIKQQVIEEQEEQIITMQPKVDYHDTVLNSNNLKTVTAIAKDLSISAIKLNKILAGLGIQYKQSDTWYLKVEYQHLVPEYCDYHITEYGQALKWTEKGRKYLMEILEDELCGLNQTITIAGSKKKLTIN